MSLGWIYLLPTKTQMVIFKYHPKWLISCVLPAETKTLRFNKYDYEKDETVGRDLTLQFPSFLLSHSIRKPWVKPTNNEVDFPYFQLHAIDLNCKDAIKALPYRIANIYSSGTICFGEVALDEAPANARQANNYFWGTPFNDDGSIFYDQHARICGNRHHEYYEHIWPEDLHGCENKKKHTKQCIPSLKFIAKACNCPCECECCQKSCSCACGCECCLGVCGCECACNLTEPYFKWVEAYNASFIQREYMIKTNYFCGSKYFATPKPATALFFSNNTALSKTIPDKHWRKDAQNCRIVIGTATKNNKSWDIDLGSFQFTLASSDVEVLK